MILLPRLKCSKVAQAALFSQLGKEQEHLKLEVEELSWVPQNSKQTGLPGSRVQKNFGNMEGGLCKETCEYGKHGKIKGTSFWERPAACHSFRCSCSEVNFYGWTDKTTAVGQIRTPE